MGTATSGGNRQTGGRSQHTPSVRSQALAQAADLERTRRLHASILFSRGVTPVLKPTNIGRMQPLQLFTVLLGLSAWSHPVYARLYRPLAFCAVLTMPCLLGWLTFASHSRLTLTTRAGVGLISLSSLACWRVTSAYLRSPQPRELVIAIVAMDTGLSATVEAMTRFYAWLAILASIVVSAAWAAVVWASLWADRAASPTRAVLICHTLGAAFNIGTFCCTCAIFALICHLHRMEMYLLSQRIVTRVYNHEAAIERYETVVRSLAGFASWTSRWLVPTLAVFVLSLAFQIWGLFRAENSARTDFNAAYYTLGFGLVLLLLVALAASINSQARFVRHNVASMYANPINLKDELASLLMYLQHTPEFAIANVPIRAGLVAALAAAYLAVVGAFLNHAAL